MEQKESDDPNIYEDYVGDIKTKLEKNKLRFEYMAVTDSQQMSKDEKAYRVINQTYQALKKRSDNEQKQQNDVYPYRKRYCSLVDRRESRSDIDKDDDVFTYECPEFKNNYTRDIPDNEVPEWYISASKTCLLPNMEYIENKAIGKPDPKALDEEEKKKEETNKDKNIGATFHCKGGLLTFSFHAKAINKIKCYIFWYVIILILYDTISTHFCVNEQKEWPNDPIFS